MARGGLTCLEDLMIHSKPQRSDELPIPILLMIVIIIFRLKSRYGCC